MSLLPPPSKSAALAEWFILTALVVALVIWYLS